MTARLTPPQFPAVAPVPSLRVGTSLYGHAEVVHHPGPQVPISTTTILHEVRPWFKSRFHRGVTLVPGGADAWAATDFAGWLNQAAGSLPGRYWDIERDAAIHHHPDHRVALLFNRRATASPHPLIAVGVRVQSLLISPGRFAQGVTAELARLQADQLRPPFDQAERFVLALTMDGGGASALVQLGFETQASLPTGQAVMWRGVGGGGWGIGNRE